MGIYLYIEKRISNLYLLVNLGVFTPFLLVNYFLHTANENANTPVHSIFKILPKICLYF